MKKMQFFFCGDWLLVFPLAILLLLSGAETASAQQTAKEQMAPAGLRRPELSSPELSSPEISSPEVSRVELPDAPVPQSAQSSSSGSAFMSALNPPLTGSNPNVPSTLPYARLYDRTIFIDQQARPLLGIDKLRYSGEEMIRPINLAHAAVSAEFSQFQGGDPKFGSGFGSYSQRFGDAMLRDTSYRLFADGIFPFLLHEDPRYYRMTLGPVPRRAVYAFTRTFITRNDAGRNVPNYGTLLGHAAGAALTLAYYPATSQGGGVVLRTLADSLAVQIGLDWVREFAPSLRFLL